MTIIIPAWLITGALWALGILGLIAIGVLIVVAIGGACALSSIARGMWR